MPTPALPSRLQLTGGDYFIHAIDRQMQRAGIPGNICRMVLRLEGPLDLEQLRAVLANSPAAVWLAGIRMRRPVFFLSPFWHREESAATLPLYIHEYTADAPNGDGAGFTPDRFMPFLRADQAPALRFDLFPAPDGATHLVLSWHHALMDVRGAQLLLRHLAESGAAAADGSRNGTASLHDPRQENFSLLRLWRSFPHKFFFSRQSVALITRICRKPIFSLLPALRPVAPCRVDYRTLSFSADETARIDAHCGRLNAAFRRSHFYLACTVRAFHALAAARGNRDDGYIIPVPHDLRRRGGSGPIFSNHVSFLFFRIEPAQAASLPETLGELTRQMTEQVRERTPESFMAVMELFRPTPLDFYVSQLGRASGGKFASFFFSDAGESCPGMEEFFGARIMAVTHYAPASRPPGLTVVFSRTRGRLGAVISRVSDCVSDGELDELERGLRAALLGGEEL